MRVMSLTLLWHSRAVYTSSDDLWFVERPNKNIFEFEFEFKL